FLFSSIFSFLFLSFFSSLLRRPPRFSLFPYTTLFRSSRVYCSDSVYFLNHLFHIFIIRSHFIGPFSEVILIFCYVAIRTNNRRVNMYFALNKAFCRPQS